MNVFVVYMCLCLCSHVCGMHIPYMCRYMYVCVHVGVVAQGWHQETDSMPLHLIHQTESSQLNSELTDKANLDSQLAPEIPVSVF